MSALGRHGLLHSRIFCKEQRLRYPCSSLELRPASEGKELVSAKKIASLLDAEAFVEINLDYFTKFGASSLTDKEMQSGV